MISQSSGHGATREQDSPDVRVLLTGVGGQVGGALADLEWPDGYQILKMDRQQLDLAQPQSVYDIVMAQTPDLIINPAAFTAVDRAEEEEDLARIVNGQSVGELVRAARELAIPILHVSTDYVFDGNKDGWYVETDQPNPVTAYGRSKLIGEEHVTGYDQGLVLRTAWVYHSQGANFVKTMRRLAATRSELSVVADQWGCPTAAIDLARTIRAISTGPSLGTQHLYHVASPEATTWHEFASEILQSQLIAGDIQVHAITTEEYPTPAQRPLNSRLDCTALQRDFDLQLPDWRESLQQVLNELDKAEQTSGVAGAPEQRNAP